MDQILETVGKQIERPPEKETLDWRYIAPAGEYGQRDHGNSSSFGTLSDPAVRKGRTDGLKRIALCHVLM